MKPKLGPLRRSIDLTSHGKKKKRRLILLKSGTKQGDYYKPH